MSKFLTGLLLIMLGISSTGLALTSTETLPKGISNPQLRFGFIENLDQRFTKSGDIMYLGDTKSIVFDSRSLMNLNAAARNLVEALNRFGTQELGNNLHLGVLRIKTIPQIRYFAPVLGRGITDSWSVGLGLPIVTYRNTVALRQEGSNLDFYRSQLTGLSPELDRALNTNLVAETQATILERGYKPISNKDETFLADIHFSSLYRFMQKGAHSAIYQATITLPTGPEYEPDDLVAINSFGRLSIENKFAYQYQLDERWKVAPYFSNLYNFTQDITMRVPLDEGDYLPDSSQKSAVRRTLGAMFSLGSDWSYTLTKAWKFGFGFEAGSKLADQVSGATFEAWRYDLLERGTSSNFQRVTWQATYSTIDAYFKKIAIAPMMVSFTLADTIAGQNIERRTVQEMNMMLFF